MTPAAKAAIVTGMLGTNADLFPEILRLYVPAGATVADVTFGRGVFWRKVPASRYKVLASDLRTGTDARCLPLSPGSVDAVVFDPPYMHSGGSVKASLDRCYGNNGKPETWRDLLPFYREVAREAHRVLVRGGLFIAKCQDTVVNHRQLWMHAELLSLPGFLAEDLFVLLQRSKPLMSGKWRGQQHARKNHSYFVVLRKNGELSI